MKFSFLVLAAITLSALVHASAQEHDIKTKLLTSKQEQVTPRKKPFQKLKKLFGAKRKAQLAQSNVKNTEKRALLQKRGLVGKILGTSNEKKQYFEKKYLEEMLTDNKGKLGLLQKCPASSDKQENSRAQFCVKEKAIRDVYKGLLTSMLNYLKTAEAVNTLNDPVEKASKTKMVTGYHRKYEEHWKSASKDMLRAEHFFLGAKDMKYKAFSRIKTGPFSGTSTLDIDKFIISFQEKIESINRYAYTISPESKTWLKETAPKKLSKAPKLITSCMKKNFKVFKEACKILLPEVADVVFNDLFLLIIGFN